MTHIERSALVMFSAEQMFDLVNDVERYPEFLPGCVGAREIARSDQELQGELQLARAGVKQAFVTRNVLERPTRMTMELVEGPFTSLRGEWRFTPLAADACKVEFELHFEFSSRILAATASKLFSGVANDMVDAMCRRAEQVYGKQ